MAKKLRRYTQAEIQIIQKMKEDGATAAKILKVIRRTRKGTSLASIYSQIAYQRRRKVSPDMPDLQARFTAGFKRTFLSAMVKSHGDVTIADFAKVCEASSLTRGLTLSDLAGALR